VGSFAQGVQNTPDGALVLDPARGAQALSRERLAAHFRGVVISISPEAAARRMHGATS